MDGNHVLRRAQRGITLIELMVALTASAIVLLALGNVVLVNQKAVGWSQDRAELQGHTTVVMSRIARSVRGANQVVVSNANTFRLYDLNGTLTHTYALVSAADGPRLQLNGADMADQNCTRFTVTPNADTTSVTLDLELTSTDGVTLGELSTVSIRNRTLEF